MCKNFYGSHLDTWGLCSVMNMAILTRRRVWHNSLYTIRDYWDFSVYTWFSHQNLRYKCEPWWVTELKCRSSLAPMVPNISWVVWLLTLKPAYGVQGRSRGWQNMYFLDYIWQASIERANSAVVNRYGDLIAWNELAELIYTPFNGFYREKMSFCNWLYALDRFNVRIWIPRILRSYICRSAEA